MARNYYSEIHLHITWHTKESAPLLVPKVETMAHHAIRDKCVKLPGVFVHEIGGTETHVHVAVRIAPTVLISEAIGQIKGYSSHDVNKKLGDGQKVLQWQDGYGVVSFGTRNLDWVTDYIRNQKQRHAERRMIGRLERVDPEAEEGEYQAER
ncbi:MAG: IS200/IS605 family transposase [Gemmataceae bacterium]